MFKRFCLPSLYFIYVQVEDGIRDIGVTGVQTCALPISAQAFFLIFFLLHRFASPFSRPPSVFLWQKERFVDICAFPHAFPPHAKTPLPWFPLFSCESCN